MLFFWNAVTMSSSHRKVRDWKTDVSVDNWTHTCRKRYVQKNSYSFQKAEEICRLRTWWARGRGRLWIHISHRPLGRASECGFHLPSSSFFTLPSPPYLRCQSTHLPRPSDDEVELCIQMTRSTSQSTGLGRTSSPSPSPTWRPFPCQSENNIPGIFDYFRDGTAIPKPPSTYEDVTQEGRPAWPALRWRCHSHIRWCTWDASGVTLSTDSLSVFKSGKPTMRNGEAAGRRLSDHVIRR